ncbi:hypothetical protein tb265_05350 [Gemmatimonadetes bacterium T265]|nr:hypothetical protein tb265_05350 [Gemmatimonadetes bacterium T265]
MATQADISAALQQAGVTVYGLQVADNSVVGTVGSEDERQKVYSTVAGIDNSLNLNISIDPGFATQEASAAATTSGQTYTVQSGDNMRRIARHVYGDEMQWKKIWEANKDKIPNPDVVREGLQLTIPA